MNPEILDSELFYVLGLVSFFLNGWLLRGWLPPSGSVAPKGKIVGSKTVHVVIVRDKLGRRVPACAESHRVLPEFVLD